jgi:cytidylate kinase
LTCIITIDGPTGSGKSTVSRMLAERLNYLYLDTGAMYRALGLAIWRKGIDIRHEKEVERVCKSLDIRFLHEGKETKVYLWDEDITKAIRDPIIDLVASNVSALKPVRKVMTRLQRNVGDQGPLVAEGRDMGTVVFPQAKHKFYLDASLEVRVDRRFQERNKRGEPISMKRVREDLIKRDRQDMSRTLSPLKPAKDAKVIDTTNLDPELVVQTILHELHPQT